MRNVLILYGLSIAVCAQGPPGVIAGRLADDDGAGISNGRVSLLLVTAAPARGLVAKDWLAATGVDGSFRFTGLFPGRYRVCAQAPEGPWLGTCEWSPDAAPTVELTAAVPVVNLTVALKRGVVLPIRVDDPSGYLGRHEGKTPGAHLLVGIGGGGALFHPASPVKSDANGRDYQVLVPEGTPLTLVMSSAVFQMADSSGRLLATSPTASFPVMIFEGAPTPSFRFSVVAAR